MWNKKAPPAPEQNETKKVVKPFFLGKRKRVHGFDVLKYLAVDHRKLGPSLGLEEKLGGGGGALG